jgi:hypothetical protein
MNEANQKVLTLTSAQASRTYYAMNDAASESHGANIILMEILKQLLEVKELLASLQLKDKQEK